MNTRRSRAPLGADRIVELPVKPGIAADDPIVMHLGNCLMPATERHDRANDGLDLLLLQPFDDIGLAVQKRKRSRRRVADEMAKR